MQKNTRNQSSVLYKEHETPQNGVYFIDILKHLSFASLVWLQLGCVSVFTFTYVKT